jgi:REP element-mobilizing transposase RayT
MRGGSGEKCAYLLTLWTYGDRPVLADAEAARLFCRVLGHLRRRLAFHLHAYVVLPDRVRLIVATPDGDPRSVQVVVRRLKARFAREWNWRRGRLGLVWQDADQMAALQGLQQIARRADLLHRSPVLAGLVRLPREWPWSSVRPWVGAGTAPATVDLPEMPERRVPRPGPSVSG